jgi:hypothetical protein
MAAAVVPAIVGSSTRLFMAVLSYPWAGGRPNQRRSDNVVITSRTAPHRNPDDLGRKWLPVATLGRWGESGGPGNCLFRRFRVDESITDAVVFVDIGSLSY